ncbi:MAG: hypothetical protein OEL66_01445 [Desulfobulbaceae bacterium]|nr:hypothetical protein [Desulfobulbaceae bacterium]
MKKILYIPMIGLFLLIGCTTMNIDREHGKASMSSWDMQIADKDPAVADQTPEGLPGISAEEMMDVRNKSFGEEETDIGSITVENQ